MSYFNRFCLTLLCLMPVSLFGDALMLTRAMTASTIAEVFVEQDHVRVELEIAGRDLPAFRNMLPSSIHDRMGYDPQPAEKRLAYFFSHDFVIRAGGDALPGAIRKMEPRKRVRRDEVTGEPLPDAEDAGDILFVEILFPFEGRPENMSFEPPSNEQGFVAATIGLMVYHRGLPVMDFRYLSQEETLHLDWEDPWYSQFDNKNLWRQYNEPISVFLYAEPFETRVEVIVRPKDIQQWHDLGLEGIDAIPVDMQSGVKEKIAAFLKNEINLHIDGKAVTPELQRINFLKRTLKNSVVIDPPEELDAISATLGVIFSAPTDALPGESSITWNLFSPKLQVVRAAATDEAGPLPYRLRPDDNVLVWKNFLKNPTIPTIHPVAVPQTMKQVDVPLGTLLCLIIWVPLVRTMLREKGRAAAAAAGGVMLLCAILIYPFLSVPISIPGAPPLSDEAAHELVEGLLENVYISFDFRDESTVYDALDQSLVGDLLTDVYLQTKKSLELASQGGAQVKVKGIDLENADCEPLDHGFTAACVWNVMGSVGHWGHIHQRINRYQAELSIQPVEGRWKITRLDVLDEQRVK